MVVLAFVCIVRYFFFKDLCKMAERDRRAQDEAITGDTLGHLVARTRKWENLSLSRESGKIFQANVDI